MAQQCDVCGKKPQKGNKISHANNKTKRRWELNLKRVRAWVGKNVSHLWVCTRCLRSGKVAKTA